MFFVDRGFRIKGSGGRVRGSVSLGWLFWGGGVVGYNRFICFFRVCVFRLMNGWRNVVGNSCF